MNTVGGVSAWAIIKLKEDPFSLAIFFFFGKFISCFETLSFNRAWARLKLPEVTVSYAHWKGRKLQYHAGARKTSSL